MLRLVPGLSKIKFNELNEKKVSIENAEKEELPYCNIFFDKGLPDDYQKIIIGALEIELKESKSTKDDYEPWIHPINVPFFVDSLQRVLDNWFKDAAAEECLY